MLIHTDRGLAIHSHLGMTGSWHIYEVGEPWQKPIDYALITLEMSAREDPPGVPRVIVCFTPKLLEFLTPSEIKRHRRPSRLGPDLLASDLDLLRAFQRMRVHDSTSIGEAVMNQSIVCGIGNVYKSEVLFLTATHPLTRVGECTDERLEAILTTARKLMRRNLEGHTRRTRYALGGKPLWVYGRHGEACYKCQSTITFTRQGDLGRTTYWCPNCQPQSPAFGTGGPRRK